MNGKIKELRGKHLTDDMTENLAQQLQMAGLVQRDFLPKTLPDNENLKWSALFKPAEWVSGDIYDVARVDETHIGFYIADVVGHSMPAALLTMFLKQAIVMRRTQNNDYYIFSPAEVISNLNEKMTEQKLSGQQFATCCYCLLNTVTLELTCARAGHPYPILIREGQPPQQIETRGALLGIFEQTDYHEQTIQLQPGDKLIMYSDGTEPYIADFDEKKGFYLKESFSDINSLKLDQILARIEELIESEKITKAEFDDITVLGLEIS